MSTNITREEFEDKKKKLLDLYSEQGKTVDEIAQEMGRTRHGISLQLRKLLGANRLPYRKKQKAPAAYNLNPVSITSIDPADIPDDEMAAYLDKIALLEEWFKAVKAFAAQQAIENGVFYDGYEIKTTFRNTFSDASATLETLRTQFPDQFDACIQPKSVSSIKKTLGEELFNSTLAGLVNQQEKKTLVKSKGK